MQCRSGAGTAAEGLCSSSWPPRVAKGVAGVEVVYNKFAAARAVSTVVTTTSVDNFDAESPSVTAHTARVTVVGFWNALGALTLSRE